MTRFTMLMPAIFALTACGSQSGDGTQNEAVSTPDVPVAGGVTRNVSEPQATAIERVAQQSLASQPGPDGTQLDLISAKVTGDILTITLRCSGPETVNHESFELSEVSIIDNTTAQRISVLRDDGGKWMATDADDRTMAVGCEQEPGVIWMRFPAPPVTSPTVSLSMPGVAPFDGIAVTR